LLRPGEKQDRNWIGNKAWEQGIGGVLREEEETI